MAKAVFLDRDGTLNPDPGYINDPKLVSLYPWVSVWLSKLQTNGYKLFFVSNQSGVGRGLITPEQLLAVNARFKELLWEEARVEIDEIANCPHHPDAKCACRKPEPGLILMLAQKHNLDLSQSFMIGDRDSDYEVGVRAGCKKSFKIETGDQTTFVQAMELILKNESN